jgi:C2 domain
MKVWHKTEPIYTSLNPVWTLSTLSLFLIETTLAEFFENANFLEFIVKDYDTVGEDEILGSVMISKTELLEGNGNRHEYELKPHTGKNRVVNDNKQVGPPIVKNAA